MATSTQRKVSLDDLTPEQLDQLREEATQRAMTEDEQQVSARMAALLGLLRSRDHLEGCPAGDPPEGQKPTQGRMEAFGHVRPANPAKARPAAEVTVVRCVECGGQRVIEQPYSEVIADIAGEAPLEGEPNDIQED